MKLNDLSCPKCGANIDVDVSGLKTIFCPYCGSQFAIDDGSKTININKKVLEHNRYTNDADVERERRLSNESMDKINTKNSILAFLFMLASFGLLFLLGFFLD